MNTAVPLGPDRPLGGCAASSVSEEGMVFGTDAHALHVELEQRGRTSNDNVPAPPRPFALLPVPYWAL